MNIIIFANSLHSQTLTGGDCIFVECAKRWIVLGHTVQIVTTQAGRSYCIHKGIPESSLCVWSMSYIDRFGFSLAILVKTLLTPLYSLALSLPKADIIFASSFFGPDIIPGLLVKLKHPSARFMTSFYLFSRKPFGWDYSGGIVKGFFFWLNEVVALTAIKLSSGYVLVASLYDANDFCAVKRFAPTHTIPVGGGVDVSWFQSIPDQKKVYDAVFIGRFVPQKCIGELIAIWRYVVGTDSSLQLAIVGGGVLEKELKRQAEGLHLHNNIHFLGIHDGVEKGRILKSSRLFLSASRFDSGNIALDEALACGVPGVVYDIGAFQSVSGVCKVPVGNTEQFASEIINLIRSKRMREDAAQKAIQYAKTIDWSIQAGRIITALLL